MQWLAGRKAGEEKGEEKLYPGALGLAPSSAKVGDLVCIIFGCSVPLVLRGPRPGQPVQQQSNLSVAGPSSVEHSLNGGSKPASPQNGNLPTTSSASVDEPQTSLDKPHYDGERYTLIGECYIDHMMDGEGMTYFTDQDLDPRYFVLE